MELENNPKEKVSLLGITSLKKFHQNNKKKLFLILIFIFFLTAFAHLLLAQDKKTSESSNVKQNISITPGVTKSPISHVNPTKKEVIGFLPSWSVAQKVKVYPKNLTQIIYFGLSVNEDGSIVRYGEDNLPVLEWSYFNFDYFEEIRREASKSGTKILLSIKSFDNSTIDNIISNQKSTDKLTTELLRLTKDYKLDGINIDFEYFTDTTFPTSKYLAKFLNKLSTELKKDNPKLIVSIDVNATVVIRDKAYNMTEIAREVDQVILMAYDYKQQNAARSGSNSPIYGGKNENSIAKSVSSLSGRVPENKLILAIPFYGWEWQTVTDKEKSSIIEGSGALATYKRVRKLLEERKDIVKSWDDIAKSPWLSFRQYGAIKQIYYEDERSITEKISFAKDNNMGGIAIWALGYEGDYLEPWMAINSIFLD